MNSQPIRRILAFAFTAAWALLSLPAALHAQQDATPAPAQGGDQSPAPQVAPGPVGGVEGYQVPGASLGHSYAVVRFGLQEVYDSNTAYATTTSGSQASSVTTLTGGLSLQWLKRDSTFSLDYTSEGLIYNPQFVSDGTVQQLGVTEKVAARRWNLLFGENFSYLPNSAFGLGGLGYLNGISGFPGTGGVTSFNPSQVPTQTIVAPSVSQFSSTSMFQAQYLINGRSSINGSVVVGFLHFFGDNLLNTRDVNARFGYDLSLTPRDTLNFSYMATILDYPSGGIPGFTSHYAQVGYRRYLTGRLQFFVSAGPVISHFSPMMGQTTVSGGANYVSWSLQSTLDYVLRKGRISGSYTHGVAGGSGYFAGSTSDQFSGNYSQKLGRFWSFSFLGGYAHNGAIQQTLTTGVSPSAAFDYWFAGVNVSRSIGRNASLSFNYNVSEQTTNTTVCANMLACGPIALTQVAGMTLNWSSRPHKLD